MCNFLSGILFRNGDVITSPYTDAHEDIIADLGLDDSNSPLRNWIRGEYTSGTLTEINTYKLIIDECPEPEWVTEELKEQWAVELKNRAEKCILLKGEKKILLGGKWVLGGDVKINSVKNLQVIFCGDNASITDVWGKTSITNVGDNASITNVGDNASITDVWGNASITDVWGNASITDVWDNASITNVWDNASIKDVGGNASITNVWDNASIKNVRGKASITNVGDNASITDVWDNASIKNVRGKASITNVWGNASITNVGGKASITNDKRNKRNRE